MIRNVVMILNVIKPTVPVINAVKGIAASRILDRRAAHNVSKAAGDVFPWEILLL